MSGVYTWLGDATGRAVCSVQGASTAGFLSTCAHCGIALRDVECTGASSLRFEIALRDVGRAKRLAARACCTLRVAREQGGAALARRVRRRAAAAAFLLLAMLLLAWSKLYIWEIGVSGNERVSAGRIRSALTDCGVELGTFWPKLRSERLRTLLLLRIPELAWATVNIYGSRAEVIVRERVEKPALFDEKEPVDLVASRVGFVREVRALNGTAAVRPGSAVAPGELLIAGAADSAFSGRRTLHAVGSVTAETCYSLSAVAPSVAVLRTERGTPRSRWSLLLGKKRINFYRNSSICPENCDKIISIWECRIKGLFALPISLRRETLTPYEPVETPRDARALRAQAELLLRDRLSRALGEDGSAVSEAFTCSADARRITACLHARCSENIAKEKRA